MKKIIFVHLLNDFSGSPKVLSQVINACKNKEFDIELLTSNQSEGFLTNISNKHQFYYYKRFQNKIATLFSLLLSQLHLFIKLLKYRNEDVTIYINTMLPFGAAMAGKIMKKPVTYHIHETNLSPKVFKQFLRFIIKHTASRIIFVSNTLKESEQFKNIKQHTVYNALPRLFAEQASENQYLHKDANGFFNVLMICSLRAYKGVEEFVTISKKCKTNKAIKFTLVLNESQTEIDDYFATLQIPNNLAILSTQKKLDEFYKKANLVLNLSRIDQWVETFGLTIIEAMAYGIPVIVPPVGGPSELVTDGKEGFLISSYETESIANKIIELSNNETTCLKLSKQALNRSMDFKEETFNTEILKIIND